MWLAGALGLLLSTIRSSSGLSDCHCLAPKAALLLELRSPGGFGPCVPFGSLTPPAWCQAMLSCLLRILQNPVHTLGMSHLLPRPYPTSSLTSTVCTKSATNNKTHLKNQRGGSAVKNVRCSSRGPEFGSENPCQATYNHPSL